MRGNVGDEPTGSPMPPAITQRGDGRRGAAGNGRLAPPFVMDSDLDEFRHEPGESARMAAAPAPEEGMPWESADEGVVEPVFEADTDAVLAELSHQAKKEEFPLDAFIVPEETKRVPAGLEGKAVPAYQTPSHITALADRLEKLSHRLRVEELDVMLRVLAGGDRLDALLAGLLAGYLAGSSDQD